MASAAADRFRTWVERDGPARPVAWFRMAFALVWLAYDVLDLWLSGTAHIHNWLRVEAPTGLVGLQVGLIVCELSMVLGEPVGYGAAAPLLAAGLRAAEWTLYLHLNDFAYFTVTALILAQARDTGGLLHLPARTTRVPRWPRDLLVYQAAWTYLATGLMKLNATWLSGRHLFVRLEYVRGVLGWRFPDAMSRCADSLACDAGLAWAGVTAELSLGALLLLRPRRAWVAPLVVGIHTFGALATNVWFFGPSLVAQVTLLTGGEYTRPTPRARA